MDNKVFVRDQNLADKFLFLQKFDLIKGFYEQRPKLNELSPSGVNTVRIFTWLNEKDELDEAVKFIETLIEDKEKYDYYSKNAFEASKNFRRLNADKLVEEFITAN